MQGFFWLASYPKSGNTWMRLALSSLAQGGAAVDFGREMPYPAISARRLFDRVMEIDSSSLTIEECERLRPRMFERLAQITSEPLLRKVHDAWRETPAGEPLFPRAVTRGVIYMVRDPRDIAVSFAAYLAVSIDEAIARMADRGHGMTANLGGLQTHFPQRLGRWCDHVESWVDAARVPVHLVRYEDMLAAPVETLRAAAGFLGWRADEGTVAAAVAATRFARLQRQEEQIGFSDRAHTAARFFRRGVAGGWRDELDARQAHRIVDVHGAVMRRLGYGADTDESS